MAFGSRTLVLLLIFIALDSAATILGQDCARAEIEALENFMKDVVWSAFSSWNSTMSCCQWPVINCSSTESVYSESGNIYVVQEINLSGKKLKGSLSDQSLPNLRGLKHLDLSNNFLSGAIPRNLSSLPRLQWLDLSSNNLSGTIEPGFEAAVRLNFSTNRLSGEWHNLGGSALESLDLSNNAFSAEISSQLCMKHSQLQALNISGNEISGEIPSGITRCQMIQVLDAEDNEIRGSIPSFLQQLPLLKVLKLSFNKLNGSIPPELQTLDNLEEIWLNQNSLQGSVNSALFGKSLRIFSARDNSLSGKMLIDCSELDQLVYLDLSYNQLNDTIPASIGSCFRLQTLALTGNYFRGEIPPEIGFLRNLTTLMLSKNNLVGRIPLESLQNCSSLVAMVLSINTFSGSLDFTSGVTIDGFQSLQLLALGNSNLSGSIPSWVRNCSKLQVLDLSWNGLTGEIPQWIGDFEHLFYLDLSNNSLAGEFPTQLSHLKTLRGELNETADLKPVESILFVKHKNNMTRLQYNQVSALPPSILLSGNHLQGSFPESFGALKKLVCLDLSDNRLFGEIPWSLGNLSSLETLDLSSNLLSGMIPSTLVRLFSLARLNLSYNHLQGRVPIGNQFDTFSSGSYLGNPLLCGYPLASCSGSSPSPKQSFANITTADDAERAEDRRRRAIRARNLAIGISLSLGLGFTGITIAVLIWILSTRRAVHHRDDEDEKDEQVSEMMKRTVDVFQNRELLKILLKMQRPLTNADLVKATNNFHQSNIVGCGGFGLVFVACLADGTKVAIKKLTGDCLQMEREFEAEVQALAMADHPNLVTLQGYSSYGDQRLLIYSYMENGSLDYWLHESVERLDWSTRLNIARGAARGLAYLHLDCQPHIVHRDIKSSNILLDGKFVAHVADFGLARLMLPTATHVSTEVVGTLGYIPPEYAQSWMATPKGDVYSFGVVLLELLARRRPVDVCRTGGVYDLVAWVRNMKACKRGVEIMDSSLRGKGNDEEMDEMLGVACLCINPNPQKRPGIDEVVNWLQEIGSTNSSLKI